MSNEALIAETRERSTFAEYEATADAQWWAARARVLADALEATERKPVIDREALARVLDEEYDHYSPTYNEQGQCVSSTMADAVVASGLIEDKRAVQAEALEAAAEIARRYNKGYSQHPHDYIVQKTQATIAATIAERAAEIREGRQ